MSLWIHMSICRQQIHEAGQRFYHGMMEHEQEELQCKFMDLDENGDGGISVQELLNRYRSLSNGNGNGNGGGSEEDDRVRLLFHLVDEDRNGLLDFEECKALFFLFACGRFCVSCAGLIIRDGVSCLHCLSFDLCCYCVHHHRHSHYHYYFQAFPALISSSPQQQQLPPVITRQCPSSPQLQDYYYYQRVPYPPQQQNYYYNQGFPYHHPQFPLLPVHQHHHAVVVAPPPPQQNPTNNTGRIGTAVYGTLATVNAVSNVISIASLCSIM